MRVSTVKNYDNKDVIKQIFDLNARTGAMETAVTPVREALSQGIASSQQLNAETNARIAGDALLRSGVDASVNGVLIEGTDTSMTVTVEKNTGPPLTTPLPVASPVAAGVMNAETFNSIVTMQNRVTALENRRVMYTVTLPTEHPTQSEVTTAYTTTYPTAPNPPLTGTVVADLPKNFQCTWDGNQNIWVKTVVGVGQATNDTLGIVKGANSAGKAFVETDGTMSVVGWDGLGARVTACEDTDTTQNASISSLGNRVTAVEADMSEVDETLALKADKTELAVKADKTELAVKADKTELASLIVPLFPPVNCTDILTMYKNNTSITATPAINAENCTSLASIFNGCTNLKTARYIHCPKVTNMQEMFYGCTSLTAIPLLDTSKVTTMYEMFRGCSSLTTFPLLDTSSVTNMQEIFANCSSLVTIPLLDTAKVTSMSNMFRACSSLTTIPLLDTAKVTNMGTMFANCSSLTTIPSLDTSSVTTMSYMFYNCPSLVTIPSLDISSATNMASMFYDCGALTSVTFQCNNVRTYGNNMFSNTPIASGTGRIYVPDDLVHAYKTASGWSAHASVIYGHSDKP